MDWPSTLTLLALAGAAVIGIALAAHAWRHRTVPGARSFAGLMVAVAVMSAAYAMQLSRADVPSSLFWGNVEYLGIVAVPLGWLAFALEYTGRSHFLNRRTVPLLLLIPLLTLVLAWTNETHGLVRQALRLEPAGSLLVPVLTRGPWFWIYAAYAYGLLLTGTVLLITFLLRGGYLARRQGGGVLVAALAPWVSNALYLARLTPYPQLDPTPLAFTLSGVIAGWDLFAFRMLDLVPVARDTVLSGMRDGVIVVDARGRIVELNPAAEAIIGSPARAVVGRPAVQALTGWPAALTAPIEAPAPETPGKLPGTRRPSTTTPSGDDEHEGNVHVEVRLGGDGARRIYDLQITPLRGRRDLVGGRVGVVREVTERVRAEGERRRLLKVQAAQAAELSRREAEAAALRNLDHLKTELLTTVSHELRTPLTIVHGYAQHLNAQAATLERADVQRIAQRLLTASTQLARLVDDLLDLDRLERGEIALHPAPFDLVPLLAEVLDAFRERPGGELLEGSWPAELWVTADRVRIGQVVANLLENVLRYAAGRPAVIRALAVPAVNTGSVTVGAADSDGAPPDGAAPAVPMVRVEVEDQGPGIRQEEQAQVWERFYRGHGVAELSLTRGSGVGLSIVKALVEAHGGRVGLESTPGRGSCFWFELPAGAPAIPAQEGEPRTGAAFRAAAERATSP